MALKGNYITSKQVSTFYQCGVVNAQRKLSKLALALGITREMKNHGIVPNCRMVSYQQFADAHNITLEELENRIK